MGVYKASVITQGGQDLIVQAIAENKTIIFTSAKISSYVYPLGTNIAALTGLRDIEQSVIPFDSKVINKNVAQVSVRFDNDEVVQPYLINTIGLYAKAEGETEILFSVTQANIPDEMPVHSDVSPSAFIYNIQSTIQNASQVSVTVNPAGTATVQDILAIRNPEFDDSGEVEEIENFSAFLEKVKSKMNIFQFFRDFKAGMKFVLHAGQIVNNCTSERTDLPLAAKQGKELMDLYTQLYSNLGNGELLSTGILQKAEGLPAGCYIFRLNGEGYTGNDLPPGSNSYKYGTACIYKRSNISIIVVLYGEATNSPIAINSRLNNWAGWQTYVTNSDFNNALQKTFSGIDLNTIVTTCFGYCVACTNTPNSTDGYLEVISAIHSPGIAFQRFTTYNTHTIYTRQKLSDGVWMDWAYDG